MLHTLFRKIFPGDQPAFLLKDDFSQPLAVDLIDGTLAPGTGTVAQRTRKVTDSNHKLSIASGLLNFATGGAAVGDPGLWYGLYTRTAGRMLIVEHTPNVRKAGVGWDSAQTGAILDQLKFGATTAGNLELSINGATGLVVGTYTSGLSYYVAGIMRATGIYWFIKGGTEYTLWKLLYATASVTADAYPGIGTAATSVVGTSSFARIPQATWLPPVLAYDTFTRTGAIGSTETTDPDGNACSALVWTGATWTTSATVALNTPNLGVEQDSGNLVVGTFYSITATEVDHFFTDCIVGNTFKASSATALDANNKVRALTTQELFACVTPLTSNVVATAKVTITTNGKRAGMVLCLDSITTPTAFMVTLTEGSNAKLDKYTTAGGWVNVIMGAITYSAGKELRVIKDETLVTLYYNDLIVGTTTAVTNAEIVDNNLHGLFSTYNTNYILDFTVRARGNEGQYSQLDAFIK